MSYRIIELEQGSSEWLEYRKNKITATDTAKIMNLSPFCTPLMLWEEKLGLRQSSFENDKMKEGRLLEEEARNLINSQFNTDYKPLVAENIEYPFMMASIDGFNSKGWILEIKCGEKSYQKILDGEIPSYYVAQMQKQAFVLGCEKVEYACYRPKKKMITRFIERDDAFIEKMIEAEKEFYRRMIEFDPPEASEKDYVQQDSKEWRMFSKIALDARNKKKEFEMIEKEAIEKLIEISGGVCSEGYGVRLTKGQRKGVIDYSCIPELNSINLEAYRKKSTTFWRLSNETEKKT